MIKKYARQVRELLQEPGVEMYPKLPNPIKKISKYDVIVYCFNKGIRYEVLLDIKNLKKIAGKGTWIAHSRKDRSFLYALSGSGINRINMHQLIMGETPEGFVIDHIDGNGLNNLESNLRFITATENMINRKCNTNNPLKSRCITIKNGFYYFHIMRKFKNYENAQEARNKVLEILNEYSKKDAEERIKATK